MFVAAILMDKGWVKCLLLLYKWIILVFFGCSWRRILLLGPRLFHKMDGKSHNMELKSSKNYSTNHASQNHATTFLWPRGRTHIRM